MKKIDISTKAHPNTFALVDDEDFGAVSKYHWNIVNPSISRTMYAQRYIVINGSKGSVIMHREIMQVDHGSEIDHRNGNGLDNQKHNLRICTHQQNLQNRQRNRNNKSGYKGVRWSKRINRWRVRIGTYPKRRCGGSYTCLIKAAQAYDRLAKEMYGEFAWLNFPEE